MPTTIEDLEAAIEETASQANSILLLNHNILKEYEDRQRKVIPFAIFACSFFFPSPLFPLSSLMCHPYLQHKCYRLKLLQQNWKKINRSL